MGAAVTGFEQADGRLSAVATDDASFPADLAVLGLGVRPNSGLAADTGVDRGDRRDRDRCSHAHLHRRRLGGWRLRGVHPPHHRTAGGGGAGHSRQQARQGDRHQPGRRRGHLPV
ncbi:MAG: hypothetical protein M5U19_11940 [Microthrixaceae bacterium]|nr:hypothetical protein [Microthrixaceae bacterium]